MATRCLKQKIGFHNNRRSQGQPEGKKDVLPEEKGGQ